MDPAAPAPGGVSGGAPIAGLLAALEELSRARPDRVLRLRGQLPVGAAGEPDARGEALEPFELLIFRGFSSSTTHPTAFDPDRPALPEGSVVEAAEMLEGPLRPGAERLVAGPGPVLLFLDPDGWG